MHFHVFGLVCDFLFLRSKNKRVSALFLCLFFISNSLGSVDSTKTAYQKCFRMFQQNQLTVNDQ